MEAGFTLIIDIRGGRGTVWLSLSLSFSYLLTCSFFSNLAFWEFHHFCTEGLNMPLNFVFSSTESEVWLETGLATKHWIQLQDGFNIVGPFFFIICLFRKFQDKRSQVKKRFYNRRVLCSLWGFFRAAKWKRCVFVKPKETFVHQSVHMLKFKEPWVNCCGGNSLSL